MKFVIHKNKHYSSNLLYKLFSFINLSSNLAYTVKFDRNCIYALSKQNQKDLNKLFGFSNGFHHKNSARFGWYYSPYKNQISLWAYCYLGGKRVSQFICHLDLETEYNLYIYNTAKGYLFSVAKEDSIVEICLVEHQIPLHFLSYKLWPYFGGKCPAPQEMHIHMKKLLV